MSEQLVDKLTRLAVERKPRDFDVAVRFRQIEQRPPVARSVTVDFYHVRLRWLLIEEMSPRTVGIKTILYYIIYYLGQIYTKSYRFW